MAVYNPEKCFTIPCDSRIGLIALWLASLLLLVHDACDNPRTLGLESACGIFLALVATCWTAAVMHCHSRRVLLEVISYEHRQTREQQNPPIRLTR